jgi:uncharacterized repeat protein (TIGR01451 family)
MRSRSRAWSAAAACLGLSSLFAVASPAAAQSAPDSGTAVKAGPELAGNVDVRVNAPADLDRVLTSRAAEVGRARTSVPGLVKGMLQGAADLQAAVPGAEVRFSALTGAAEIVRGSRPLTAAAPGRAGIDVVRGFLHANRALYGLSDAEIDGLRFLGESLSRRNGLRMVRVEQVIAGLPVFQSDSRFLIDKQGRLVRAVALLVPGAAAAAPALASALSPEQALTAAMRSVGIDLPAGTVRVSRTVSERAVELAADDPRIAGEVEGWMVWFPAAPGVLVPAWQLIAFTTGEQDWNTVVDAASGVVLWRKGMREYASTQEARFSVYVTADGTTPADSPAPHSPTDVVPGSGTQFPEIARTIVDMSAAQDLTASPNGWIDDGGTTTTGNNVDACVDRIQNATIPGETNLCDAGTIDNNGRPVGNPDGNGNNRDFLGAAPRDYTYTPAPLAGNPDAGDDPTGVAATQINFRRGAVTQLFYVVNWYHDKLFDLGFDEAAGNFQQTNFSGMGAGGDRVRADAQDGSGTNNANFSTPPDGASGRAQMFRFTGPAPDRDGDLDGEVLMHELTHGTSNRLIGNANGLNWDPGRGMGEGWSDFYAISLLNATNADDPNAQYASGAYATYQFLGLTDNYLYGIRRYPYTTDNTINPMTWADVDDITVDIGGGSIPPSPVPFTSSGAFEVHNTGEIWALTLWEVRSRVIADPAGANGDVPTGNTTMLQLVTDGMKMTPISPSVTDARDALIDADCATNACANEQWIWEGFADRGLGYKAVAPLGTIGPSRTGARGRMPLGESFSLPYLDVASVAIDDSLGNNNGAIDPGEPVFLTVTLTNPWRAAAKGAAAVLASLTTSTLGVTVIDGASSYGTIPPQGSAPGDTYLIILETGVACGSSLHFEVETLSSLGSATASFTLRVGTSAGPGAPVTLTRSVPGGLAVPDANLLGVSDTFNVSSDLQIADLDFRVDSMTHTYMGDIGIELKGPTGYGTSLIFHRGVFFGVAFADGDNFLNTRIDGDLAPAAATDLNQQPAAAAPFTGSFLPAFNSPIWALFPGVLNFVADSTDQLSRWDGTSTQGNWIVHVTDRALPDTGTLNTWSLIVTPVSFTCAAFAPSVVVSATKTVSGAFHEGGTVTYTVTIKNTGTATQSDLGGPEFTDVLPASLTLTDAFATSGTVTVDLGTNTVEWDGTLPAVIGSVTITIEATVNAGTSGTTISNQGTLAFDANADNEDNEASGVTDDPGTPAPNDPTAFAVAPGAQLTATKVDSGPRAEGSSVTYTVVITNSGGPQADNPGAEFTDVLPSSLTLVSAAATSGTATADVATNTVTWNGAIPAGGSVTITIDATIHSGTFGATISNQGTLSFDSNGDLTNDASGVTNDPDTPAANDPTSFVAGASAVVQIPTLSEVGFAALALLLGATALLSLRRRRTA